MRICVYGAGAMGTTLGAFLQKTGTECDLAVRRREHAEALKTKGARLIYPNGKQETVCVSACLPSDMAGRYDVIFLATKQRENTSIARQLHGLLAADGALVTVQNGLPEKELAEVLGSDRILGAALSWGAERGEDGEVKVTSNAGFHIALGAYGKGNHLQEVQEMLQKFAEVTVGDLTEIRFAKLAVNASFSTLSAISGLTFGVLAAKYRKRVMALMREVFEVARALGAKKLPLNGHDLFKVFGGLAPVTLPIAMKRYRDTRSGMLLDLENGRRCDVDFVAGAVVRAGEGVGVKCPCLASAVSLVHDIENGLAEIAPESLELL